MNKPTLAKIVFIPTFFAGLLGYWSAFPPSEPIGSANGTYASACCGSLKLENGQMFLRKQQVSYVVEHDKVGRYVLPAAYVGVSDADRVSIDRAKSALKLRLDDSSTPMTIELSGRLRTVKFRRS
ncbi:hypothetical protein ASE85_01810 [Sphingobium sp. Leaf26]|uniref:hypothetical protein n=1 Tax=Sphingobium sp. Leaf26 TaxID=1735693 RepID=UPI0006FEC777|nr:hypothetical protein [Sphingobium sp. Leaf26]KQN09708.1 hypothetical protein ASE85_01810 [Sphingobium sp. Leaf26]